MAKDAYYFSHDSNSQDDPKCMILIDQLGMEGYGIFWALIEKLRNETDYRLPIALTGSYAKRWGTSKEKVETVIKNYELFTVDDTHFFSERLCRSMQKKTESARNAANLRWSNNIDNQLANANAMQTHSKGNAVGMRNDATKGKERKGKESKEKESKEKEILYRDNISLSENENQKLISEYGQDFIDACYDLLSSYKIEKSYKTKSDYLTVKRWVIDAVTEKGKVKPKTIKLNTDIKLNPELEEYKKRQSELGQSL
jgi:hypothetical protein